MNLKRDAAIVFVTPQGEARWGVVVEVVSPFVILRGATWTYESYVTMRARSKKDLEDKLLACPHVVRARYKGRIFCAKCGGTLSKRLG